MEKTFIMIKPDGVQRGLSGEIMKRFEQKGFQLVGCKLIVLTKEMAERHYAEHEGKPFYDNLLRFITSGPVLAMVWQGEQVVQLSRILIGKTNTLDAQPGTIRGDFAVHTNLNLIHGSDSVESAEREIANIFTEEEIISYSQHMQTWI
ncbi:MAG: nucleoside-diphosphate kinase [Paenibacillus sp. RIFOXYA1_FULL_44_5]|nr:MAG: nucleoside-diphosphate kinase [Paenibacillus sp. RIFOXYA1_FULL_44_5]